MLGNPKKADPPELVGYEEACCLSKEFATAQEFTFCRGLIRHWTEKYYEAGDPSHNYWQSLCLATTLYNAGRLQGIREERTRRKKKGRIR